MKGTICVANDELLEKHDAIVVNGNDNDNTYVVSKIKKYHVVVMKVNNYKPYMKYIKRIERNKK